MSIDLENLERMKILLAGKKINATILAIVENFTQLSILFVTGEVGAQNVRASFSSLPVICWPITLFFHNLLNLLSGSYFFLLLRCIYHENVLHFLFPVESKHQVGRLESSWS